MRRLVTVVAAVTGFEPSRACGAGAAGFVRADVQPAAIPATSGAAANPAAPIRNLRRP